MDPEVVRRRLRLIDRRVSALRAVARRDPDEFVSDTDLQAQVERHLQVAIQAAIDSALHVLAQDSGETPDDYGSAFVLLARHSIVPAELADRLRLAAGLRNILVHAYLEVDAREVWRHLDDLDDLVDFAGRVETYLQRSDPPT